MAHSIGNIEDEFVGLQLESEAYPGTRYTLKKPIGGGGMGTVYFALHQTAGGLAPVVVKVISPSVVVQNEQAAILMVKKEAVALGRINERVPPTPFVVRLIEAGFIPTTPSRKLSLPWLALEYVHGGLQGTTLTERIENNIKVSGHAFDLDRASNAVRCLTEGLSAIHDAGVIHRDVTPGNVLCCGFAAEETLKIADFGVARPVGMRGTFNAVMLGTPGYAAPEQAFSGFGEVGIASDVFSLAAVFFYILTGEHYFDADNAAQALVLARDARGRKLLDAPHLCPELKLQPNLCAAIDRALAQATSAQSAHRPSSVDVLGSMMLGLLETTPKSTRSPHRILGAVAELRAPAPVDFDWCMREPPSQERLVYSAGWGGDGSCLAVTTLGIEYWDGRGWKSPSSESLVPARRLRFSTLCKPGIWLLGGSEGSLLLYSGHDQERLEPGAPRLIYQHGSGHPDDLAVFAAHTPDGAYMLCAMAARRWLKPVPLAPGASINALCRVSDSAWVVCGRQADGRGFASLFEPLMWELTPIASTGDALVSCCQLTEFSSIAVGPRGTVLRLKGLEATAFPLPEPVHPAVTASDAAGRIVVGCAGSLWERGALTPAVQGASGALGQWRQVWHNPHWNVPFVSIFTDVGLTYAMTSQGAILEGRVPLGAVRAA